jgi:2-polyprenyl-3-methyl-5-hydroxy-6-metoxy-1,4-benzoquinol methylase
MNIPNTGERILLEKETPLMIARHFCAYKFAKKYALNKRVLDIGCGEGYGSSFLAQFAEEVVGVDYDKDIIEYARQKYRKDNLQFCVIDAAGLSSLQKRFDVICSFQVIEHIRDAEFFLKSVKNLLIDNGIFLCSTPNKLDASPHSETPSNRFHVKEYLLNDFRELLERQFKKAEIFGLKRGKKLNFFRRLKKIGIFNFLPYSLDPVKKFYKRINCDNFVLVKDDIANALDFIAVSSQGH